MNKVNKVSIEKTVTRDGITRQVSHGCMSNLKKVGSDEHGSIYRCTICNTEFRLKD